jgi:hypothetical protein
MAGRGNEGRHEPKELAMDEQKLSRRVNFVVGLFVLTAGYSFTLMAVRFLVL